MDAYKSGARTALFFVCETQWRTHGVADIQLDLLERRLNYLAEQLSRIGMTLTFLKAPTFKDIPDAMADYCKEHGITEVYANIEYEVNEQARDKAVISRCEGVNFVRYHGDVIAEPGSVVTGSGDMYKVFTPFKNAWLKRFGERQFGPLNAPWQLGGIENANQVSLSVETPDCSHKWPVDDDVLSQLLEHFVHEKLDKYDDERDFPAIKGTSGFSPYLALGIITVEQCISAVQARVPHILQSSKSPQFTWVSELIWREFYRHLIVAFPDLCKYKNFNAKYDSLAWRDDEASFKAWCEGKTGYPIVDAAMRQLNQTGWMHNRLRMIVASFLTKHLLIDWRKGEAYFIEKLIDGDFASNNGGWQWAASTGCDAQPYFRIFNPLSQSEKFDPDGEFIRKYLPELKNVKGKAIHFPHDFLAGMGLSSRYWPAIVDHKAARARALETFKAV